MDRLSLDQRALLDSLGISLEHAAHITAKTAGNAILRRRDAFLSSPISPIHDQRVRGALQAAPLTGSFLFGGAFGTALQQQRERSKQVAVDMVVLGFRHHPPSSSRGRLGKRERGHSFPASQSPAPQPPKRARSRGRGSGARGGSSAPPPGAQEGFRNRNKGGSGKSSKPFRKGRGGHSSRK